MKKIGATFLLAGVFFLWQAHTADGTVIPGTVRFDLAINAETNQCSAFNWFQNNLNELPPSAPSGWEVLLGNDDLPYFSRGARTCTANPIHDTKQCCEELGLTFVAGDLGPGTNPPDSPPQKNDLLLLLGVGATVIILVGWKIYAQRKPA